jgi:hypothetical protein
LIGRLPDLNDFKKRVARPTKDDINQVLAPFATFLIMKWNEAIEMQGYVASPKITITRVSHVVERTVEGPTGLAWELGTWAGAVHMEKEEDNVVHCQDFNAYLIANLGTAPLPYWDIIYWGMHRIIWAYNHLLS